MGGSYSHCREHGWLVCVFGPKSCLSSQGAFALARNKKTRRVGGSSWHGKWVVRWYADPGLVEGQNGLVSPWGRGLSNPEAPLFSWLRIVLFTSRFSRGCGFVCSPAVLLAAAAFFVHQPFFSRLRPFFVHQSSVSRLRLYLLTSRCFYVIIFYQVFKRSSFASRFKFWRPVH